MSWKRCVVLENRVVLRRWNWGCIKSPKSTRRRMDVTRASCPCGASRAELACGESAGSVEGLRSGGEKEREAPHRRDAYATFPAVLISKTFRLLNKPAPRKYPTDKKLKAYSSFNSSISISTSSASGAALIKLLHASESIDFRGLS